MGLPFRWVTRYPVCEGIVSNWEYMSELWKYGFDRLQVSPDHPIILSDDSRSTLEQRQKSAHILFETFSVPSLRIENQSVLSLLSESKSTGLAVELGNTSHVVPVVEGKALTQYLLQVKQPEMRIPKLKTTVSIAGGLAITEFMTTLLLLGVKEETYYYSTINGREIVEDIKEKLCFISEDYEFHFQGVERTCDHYKSLSRDYQNPDGSIIQATFERFVAPELLFTPDLFEIPSYQRPIQVDTKLLHVLHADKSSIFSKLPIELVRHIGQFVEPRYQGLHYMIRNSIDLASSCSSNNFDAESSDIFYSSLASELYANIYLSGGTSRIPGLSQRIETEVQQLIYDKPSKARAHVTKKNSHYLGGCIMASNRDSFPFQSREDYLEIGEYRI